MDQLQVQSFLMPCIILASPLCLTPGCRYNRARLERLRKAREEKDFEKIFKPSFWSYSKSMLKQPISVLEGEKGDELEDTALRLFFTIQQHAGQYPFQLS